jgi:hypothetical protein
VNTYEPTTSHLPLPDVFKVCSIVDSTGQVIEATQLPELQRFQPVSANSIYSPQLNKIFAVPSGDVLFSSVRPTSQQGAVAGTRVVFGSKGTVRAEPF